MRRVGILGGTFDPVHNGHLLLGEQAYREYGLDEIWFMPSHVPPHKKDHHITDGAARIRMLELATESVPYFLVSDFEMGREGNTYTAQTLALLKEAYRISRSILSSGQIPCISWNLGIIPNR